MPTYQYRCPNDHSFEVFHGIKDETPRECPECGAVARRVPAGGAGLLFKGSGFYITDYRSSSYKEGKKAEKGGASPGASGASSSSSSAGSSGSSGSSSSGGSGGSGGSPPPAKD